MSSLTWPLYRKFVHQSIVPRSDSATSFQLVPDGGGTSNMMQVELETLCAAVVFEAKTDTESAELSNSTNRDTLPIEGSSAAGVEVTFLRSGVVARWTGVEDTLLELAETHGVDIAAGCRYGDCATCLTTLVSGEVTYLHETGVEPEPGTCLPCSCRPATSIELDA